MIRRVAERGEVAVDVRLTNVFDQALVSRGELKSSVVHSTVTKAVVDTGAVSSVISSEIAHELNLPIARRARVSLADGESQTMGVVDGLLFCILDRETSDEAFAMGKEVLIGQTVLEKLDLQVNCKNQRVIGNPEHPDGPVLRV